MFMGSELWSREKLAYLAGLFEGEGYIGWRRNPGPHLEVRLGMTDEDVVRAFADGAGVGSVYGPNRKFAPDGHEIKTNWQFVATGREAYALAVALWPWLFSRRREQMCSAITKWLSTVERIRHLSPDQVRAIRADLATIPPGAKKCGPRGKGTGRGSGPAAGTTMASIARKHGVPTTSIKKIRDGLTYRFVP